MICKDPNDAYEWTIDWAADLGADTISSSTWSAAPGIVIDGDTRTDTTTTVDLSGGTAGVTYRLVNDIQTVGGNDHSKKLFIKVQEQLVS